MLREEAIELLFDIQTDAVYNVLSDEKEALELAINVLKQQPCEDCISRQAAIDAIYGCYIGGKDAIENAQINDLYAEGLEEAVNAVWELPSVTPKAEQKAVLDKIKAEIEQIEINGHIRDVECFRAGINTALNIIDKYEAESEE